MAERFDVVVIGAGPGGFRAAKRCAQRGASVALIEREHVGGTCLNVGCIPSKTLLASAHLLLRARHAGEMGIDIPSATPNWPKIQQRREAILTGIRKGMLGTMKASKITHIEGRATVLAPGRIKVESTRPEPRAGGRQADPGDRLRVDPVAQHPLRRPDRHQQQRGPVAAADSQVHADRRRRRDRLRDGLRLCGLRHQGHDRRGPGAIAADGGLLGQPAARTRIQEPGHRGHHGPQGHVRG